MLHRGTTSTDNCILLVASRGAICTTGFSVISYCSKTLSDDLVVLDAQVYDYATDTNVKILFEYVNLKQIAMLSGIRNHWEDGFNNKNRKPTLTKFSLDSKS